jgi:hypothetical protein
MLVYPGDFHLKHRKKKFILPDAFYALIFTPIFSFLRSRRIKKLDISRVFSEWHDYCSLYYRRKRL